MIATGIAVFGDEPFGWRVMNAVSGTALIGLMYLLGRELFRRRFAAGDLLTRSKDRVTVRARASAVPNLDRRPGGLPGIRVEVTHDVAIAALGDMRAAKDCTMSSEGRTGGLPKKHASAVLLMRPAKLGV